MRILTGVRGLLSLRRCALALALALPVATSPEAAAQCTAPSFDVVNAATVGFNPTSIAVGDLNRDGRLDLVVANTASNTVSILLGVASGGWAPGAALAADNPAAVVVADFNKDGFLDLATVSTRRNEVSVFLGLGNGTFRPVIIVPTGSSSLSAPMGLAVADLDGDGNLDLVTANSGTADISVLYGQGSGLFAAPKNSNVQVKPVALVVGDFDGNGKLDVAVADYGSDQVTILLGQASRVLKVVTNLNVPMAPNSIIAADLDGDGKQDLAVVSFRGRSVSIWHGRGDGFFSPVTTVPLAANESAFFGPQGIAVADFNRDGKLDLAVGYTDGYNPATFLAILLGDGTGQFASPQSFTVGQSPRALAVADLDADGKPDLAVANSGFFQTDPENPATISVLHNTCAPPPPPPPKVAEPRLVPIVLDVFSGPARFTTELAVTNRGAGAASVRFTYTASLGTASGSGSVDDTLGAGTQLVLSDVLQYLRDKGLAIPAAAPGVPQGGTLLVELFDLASPDDAAVTARTATATQAPQPEGRAGLAYAALKASEAITGTATIFGLRSTGADRSNVAVYDASKDPVTVRVTAYSGSGDGRSVVVDPGRTLPPWGFFQFSGILAAAGMTNGYVTIERVSDSGSFGAYGVINDNGTDDGSFVPPTAGTFAGTTLQLPVLVESALFRSELVLANRSASPAVFNLDYRESLSPSQGAGGTVSVTLQPGEQRIQPEAVDFLRKSFAAIGPAGQGTYVGSLRISVAGATVANVFVGARTAAQSPAGGQFGLFTPGLYPGQEAGGAAWLYGLRADETNRTNVAVAHTGANGSGPITLQLQAYDGGAGGVARGASASVTLQPGEWAQPQDFFKASGLTNGWVKVTRTAGTAPWLAYAVINDGKAPGERTGDGAYVGMVK